MGFSLLPDSCCKRHFVKMADSLEQHSLLLFRCYSFPLPIRFYSFLMVVKCVGTVLGSDAIFQAGGTRFHPQAWPHLSLVWSLPQHLLFSTLRTWSPYSSILQVCLRTSLCGFPNCQHLLLLSFTVSPPVWTLFTCVMVTTGWIVKYFTRSNCSFRVFIEY